jgi:hypothetical protein
VAVPGFAQPIVDGSSAGTSGTSGTASGTTGTSGTSDAGSSSTNTADSSNAQTSNTQTANTDSQTSQTSQNTQTGSGQHASGQRPSGQKTSGQKTSGQKTSGQKTSGQKSSSGQKTSGQKTSGQKTSGEHSSAEQNQEQQSSSGEQQTQEQQTQTHSSGEQTQTQQQGSSAEEVGNAPVEEDTGLSASSSGGHGGSGGGGGQCFSGDAQVQTLARGIVRMDELQVGDEVLTVSETATGGYESAYSPVRWFIHRLPEVTTAFVNVVTTTKSLSMTPDHLVPVIACDAVANFLPSAIMAHSRPARLATAGECLLTVVDGQVVAEEITKVERESREGIYAPVTTQGNLVVNNVLASCYSGSFESHRIQHAMFRLVDMVSGFASHLASPLQSADGDIPSLLRFLLQASNVVTAKA